MKAKTQGILYFGVAICFISMIPFSKNHEPINIEKSFVDSPVKKEYVFVIKLSPLEWKRVTDTVSIAVEQFGVEMSVTNARVYQQAVIRQLQRLASKIILDSIIIKPKK